MSHNHSKTRTWYEEELVGESMEIKNSYHNLCIRRVIIIHSRKTVCMPLNSNASQNHHGPSIYHKLPVLA